MGLPQIIFLLIDVSDLNNYFPICLSVWCLSVTISMYLLQEHNNMEYEKFLFVIKNYICCCWRSTSIFDPMNETTTLKPTQKSDEDVTLYETHDISSNHAKIIRHKPFESSTVSTAV